MLRERDRERGGREFIMFLASGNDADENREAEIPRISNQS